MFFPRNNRQALACWIPTRRPPLSSSPEWPRVAGEMCSVDTIRHKTRKSPTVKRRHETSSSSSSIISFGVVHSLYYCRGSGGDTVVTRCLSTKRRWPGGKSQAFLTRPKEHLPDRDRRDRAILSPTHPSLTPRVVDDITRCCPLVATYVGL